MEAIELAFFPPGPSGRSSLSSAAYERARQLWLCGYLDRIELPVAPRLGGRRPYLHALGWRGVSAVASSNGNGTHVVQRRRLDRLDDLFLDHDLKAAVFCANLVDLLRDSRVTWSWTSERDIRTEKRRVYDPESQKDLRVLPDAEFKIRYPSGRYQWGMVEIDMGTHTLTRFRQKMRAVDLYAAAMKDEHEKAKGTRFEVYVLSQSAARMEQLRQATYREVGHGDGAYFYFGTFDLLAPDEFDETRWLHTDGKRYSLAYPEAFGEEGAAGEAESAAEVGADVEDAEGGDEDCGDADFAEDNHDTETGGL